MSEDDRIVHPELIKRFGKQSRLGCRRPDARAGPRAVSKAWPVKAQDTALAGKQVDKPADREVLYHRSVAVEQDHARCIGMATVDVVEPHAIAVDEPTDRWVPSFSDDLENHVAGNDNDQDDGNDQDNTFQVRHCGTSMLGRGAMRGLPDRTCR